VKAVLLAAGRGKRFGAKTKTLPKCLIPLDRKGTTLLKFYLDAFRHTGLKDVVIVVGHLQSLIRRACETSGRGLRIRFVENPEYRRGSVVSLHKASRHLAAGAVILDADVYFDPRELAKLLKSGPGSVFLIDGRSKSAGEEMMLMARGSRPVHISKKTEPGLRVLGEATGFFKLAARDAPVLRKLLRDFYRAGIRDVEYEETYSALMKKREVGFVSIQGFWSEMDFTGDRAKISAHLALNAARTPLVKSPNAESRRAPKKLARAL
jgi:choline kinase